MPTHKSTYWLILALLLVIGIRVLYFFVITYPELGDQIRHPDGYWVIAENLLNGKGYVYDAITLEKDTVTAKRGPTTVLLYLALFWLFGVSSWPILVSQWLLEAGTGWLIYLIIKQIFPQHHRAGWLATCLYAIYWPEWRYTVEARSEVLFTFLLAAFVLILLKGLQSGPTTWFASAGLLLGLVHHTKPVMSLFPVVVLALLIWQYYPHKRAIGLRFGWFLAAFAIILLPWVARNYLLFQKFIPGTTLLGYVIYHDFRDHLAQGQLLQDNNGQWLVPSTLILETTSETDYRQGKSEVELDQVWLDASKELIKRYPQEFALWSLNNVVRFWSNLGRAKWDHPGTTRPSFIGLINGATLLIAAIGYGFLVRLRGKWDFVLPILIVYYTGVHAVTSGEIRYSMPMAPYLLILITVSFLELRQRLIQQHQSSPTHATS